MALDKESVKTGIQILKEINGGRTLKLEYYEKDEDDIFSTDYIYCVGEKYDGGYETVFTNVEDITPSQLKRWNELKSKVPNTSITDKVKEEDYPYFWKKQKKTNLTCIGWF